MFQPSLRSLLCALVLAGLGGRAASQTVQFADGHVLLATVQDADGQGLRVKRLDNGGTLDLRWDQLSPASAFAIKREFDLTGESQDEVLVRADEVEYVVDGNKQALFGQIVETTPDAIVVTSKGVVWRIAKATLRQVRKVDVPPAQVFTKDEYHAQRLAALQPGQSADKHMLLAEELIRVHDYDHAAEHLQKAEELGNSRNPAQLDPLRQRLARFQAAAREMKLLGEIKAARSGGAAADFERGVKLIAQFEKDFPAPRLEAEFAAEKVKFAHARTRTLSQLVADQFRRAIQVVADKRVAEPGITIQAAREFAESRMTDEIVARLQAQLKLEAAEIRQLWAVRGQFPVGKRSEYFAYGIGSWVLGEHAILKDTEQAKAALRAAGGAAVQAAGQRERTEEDWWRDASRAERTGWLRAYYAEFGGQLVLTYCSVTPCITCAGAGTMLSIGPAGRMVRSDCSLCQKTKWLRSFKAW